MAHTGRTVQIPEYKENSELDSCLKNGFYTLIVEFSICFSWAQMTVFLFLELMDWLQNLSAGLYEPH